MTDKFKKEYSDDLALKDLADEIKSLAEALDDHFYLIEPNRERSIAMTKLEECVMWAVKAVYKQGDK